jgi:hypothetical protein
LPGGWAARRLDGHTAEPSGGFLIGQLREKNREFAEFEYPLDLSNAN